MTAGEKNGLRKEPRGGNKKERLTLEEFNRLVAEAQRRGEPIDSLVTRLVVSTIDEVLEQLAEEDPAEKT